MRVCAYFEAQQHATLCRHARDTGLKMSEIMRQALALFFVVNGVELAELAPDPGQLTLLREERSDGGVDPLTE